MTNYYTVRRGNMYIAGFQDNGIKDDMGTKYYTCVWSADKADAKYTETKAIMRDIAHLYNGKIETIKVSDGGDED